MLSDNENLDIVLGENNLERKVNLATLAGGLIVRVMILSESEY